MIRKGVYGTIHLGAWRNTRIDRRARHGFTIWIQWDGDKRRHSWPILLGRRSRQAITLESVESVSEVSETRDDVATHMVSNMLRTSSRMDVLLLIQAFVDESSDDSHFGELLCKVVGALGAGDEVEEEDAILGHTLLSQDLDGHQSRAAWSRLVRQGTDTRMW